VIRCTLQDPSYLPSPPLPLPEQAENNGIMKIMQPRTKSSLKYSYRVRGFRVLDERRRILL
jgi:hypothetical protein